MEVTKPLSAVTQRWLPTSQEKWPGVEAGVSGLRLVHTTSPGGRDFHPTRAAGDLGEAV